MLAQAKFASSRISSAIYFELKSLQTRSTGAQANAANKMTCLRSFSALLSSSCCFFAAKWFSKANSKQSERVLRYVGGGAALLLAGFLLVRGQIAAALSIGLLGLGVLGYVSLWPASFGGRTQKAAGQVSRVRTAFLEMELEHDSGAMRGRVLNGKHQGTTLDELDVKTLIGLLGEIDEDSRRLLASFWIGESPTGVNKRPEMTPGHTDAEHRATEK